MEILDKAGCWTNHIYLSDFIEFPISPRRIDLEVFRELYLQKGLSAAQIGELVGASKQMVLARLRRAGIHRTAKRGRSPDNYRYPEPPYGQKVVAGRIRPNREELKTVRVILELRDRKSSPWSQIVDHLNGNGLRTRRGHLWSRVGVKRIHARWRGKL